MARHHQFDFEHFVHAQSSIYDTALAELRRGHKVGDWMRVIFPRARSSDEAPDDQPYALNSAREARAYLMHPLLGRRITECTEAVLGVPAPSLSYIFGSPDDAHFKALMTLFSFATNDPDSEFREALETWCSGLMDGWTLASAGERLQWEVPGRRVSVPGNEQSA